MFWIIQSILLGISLAMDACAVSMGDGLIEPQMKRRKGIGIAVSFGVFQGVMPLIGYLFGNLFEQWISSVIAIIGFVILMFLGVKMIIEALRHSPEDVKALSVKTILIQAIATSIDALTVGLVYVGSPKSEVYITFLCIACITFLLCIFALEIGKKFGTKLSDKAEILGGIILICIAVKILVEYLIETL